MPRAPILAMLGLAAPILGAAWAYRMYTKASADTIGGAIGIGLGAYLIFAAACGIGEILAIISLLRGERPVWVGGVAIVLNLAAAIAPAAYLYETR